MESVNIRVRLHAAQLTYLPTRSIDKKFYQPATIERWIVVIYESQRRFRPENAQEVVNGFVQMFRAVGACMLPLIVPRAQMLRDTQAFRSGKQTR